MNKKASISKELNAKHTKILEGLLKLPENRECADCKNKAPRWASINLGIFICLHCSGIHRSLGVHISKVRSATLDTWLPEQVAFMQSMGNEKSNAYWEAELPLHYDRGRFEDFIHAKYVERIWVPRGGKVKSPPKSKQEPDSPPSSTAESNNVADSTIDKHVDTKECEKQAGSREFATNQHMEGKDCLIVGKQDADPGNPEVLKDGGGDKTTQAVPHPGPKDIQKTESKNLKNQSVTGNTIPVPPQRIDYATELFRMLCVDDSGESDLSPSSDMSTWVEFDTDEEEIIQGKVAQISSAGKAHPEPKVKDVRTYKVQETKRFLQEHHKDETNHNQSRQEEPNKASEPKVEDVRKYEVQETKRFLQEHHKDATNHNQIRQEEPNKASASFIPQQNDHVSHAPSRNGPRSINQSLGTQLQMLSISPVKFSTNTAPYTTSSLYRPAVPLNGISTTPIRKPRVELPVSGYDYDFSFLTQGMFTK